MTRKQRRFFAVGLAVVAIAAAIGLIATVMKSNIVFFYSPTDLIENAVEEGRRFRVGGLVQEGSVRKDGEEVTFVITDGLNEVTVVFTGFLPDLFREGQGVVAEGRLGEDGVFLATNVLARHDENYMPPEVAESLKETGQWQHAAPEDGGMPPFLRGASERAVQPEDMEPSGPGEEAGP